MARTSADHRPPRRGAGWALRELYDLLADPTFAILVVITLAVASLLGLLVIDQVPFRGEMARLRYPGHEQEPLVWLLIHVVPASPFRTVLYRTLLALLSLSLLACTVKRWRRASRLAFTLDAAPAGAFDARPGGASSALVWTTRATDAAGRLAGALRRGLFAVRRREGDGATWLDASRFGLARLGPVLTHLGFLLLVIGGLWLSAAGVTRPIWMSPGDVAGIPGSTLRLRLHDFRIERNPAGQISQYVSSVTLFDGECELRRAEIAVNRPLRHKGYSLYQSSYREDPLRVQSVNLVMDLAAERREAEEPADPSLPPGHPNLPGRASRPQRVNVPANLRVPSGAWVGLPGTNYAVAIDTFFADLRIDARGPTLASDEPRNPAVRLRFEQDGQPAGETWYFLMHPDMPVGSGPDLPLRVIDYEPRLATGLEVATHPGAGWIWLGFGVMSLGTVLAFLLRHERAWARVRRTGSGDGAWEIALVHQGAARQAPEFVREPWEAAATPLAIRLLRDLEPEGGRPVRWPGAPTSDRENP